MPVTIEDSTLVIRFGAGDVVCADVGPKGSTAPDRMLFLAIEPGEVGRRVDDWSEEGRLAPVALIFDTVAALDVVIGAFGELRDRMAAAVPTPTEDAS